MWVNLPLLEPPNLLKLEFGGADEEVCDDPIEAVAIKHEQDIDEQIPEEVGQEVLGEDPIEEVTLDGITEILFAENIALDIPFFENNFA